VERNGPNAAEVYARALVDQAKVKRMDNKSDSWKKR